MSAPVPFITSYELETVSPAGVPFMIEKLSPKMGKNERMMHLHRHNFYALGLCLEGTTTHMLDFEQVTINAGEMQLIIPGQVHQAMAIDGYGDDGYMIAFTADFLLPMHVILPNYATGPVHLPEEDLQQVTMLFSQLQKEYTERLPQYVAMLQHYLALLIMLFHRHAAPYTQAGPPLLTRYRELLSMHFVEWTKPAQYASAMHVSADHLNEVVKQHTGQTVSAHISERRVLEAKRLLLHAKESIKEIAWHLQFNEVSYFNRFFKQHTGITPAAFREKAREKYSSNPE
ncbi:AraC family transcriptional regulator [Chitinophaga filiformis]|uniref:helix-turn-helix domain-containing protein n=1 Tax=Chitinophaga filiformis TaxID=104663 RepID=UPI001F364A07|nr:helix-turn-helix domain-containing protein [Chitinophaga filiformis]MCF6406699.1 AraC family transcriptional regulator [Chitinophaga filiformis]